MQRMRPLDQAVDDAEGCALLAVHHPARDRTGLDAIARRAGAAALHPRRAVSVSPGACRPTDAPRPAGQWLAHSLPAPRSPDRGFHDLAAVVVAALGGNRQIRTAAPLS